MGEEQQPMLNLVDMVENNMYKPVTDYGRYSVGLSKKKDYGGRL